LTRVARSASSANSGSPDLTRPDLTILGNSGSPPTGWSRWDRRTGETKLWRAPARTFCEEVVVIPRPRVRGAGGEAGGDMEGEAGGEAGAAPVPPSRGDEADVPPSDEADVWLAAMMFDADARRSCLCILNGDDIEAGPICKLWLRSFVPHGLHGTFCPETFGVL